MTSNPPHHLPRAALRPIIGVWKVVVLALLLPLLGGSEEIIVTLKNGDRLSGTNVVTEADSPSLELDTALGRFSIPRSLIQRTDVKPAQPSPREEPKVETSPQTLAQQYREMQAQYNSGQLSATEYHARRLVLMEQIQAAGYSVKELEQLAQAEKQAVAAASGDVPTSGGAKPKIKSQFSGEARIGTDLLYGEKDQQIYSAKLKGVHTWGRLKNSADYLFTYGRVDGDLSANRMDGSLKSDWQLTERLYTYNLGGAGYDEVRKVELRYEMGPGMGYHLFKRKGFIISGELGINYQTEIRRMSSDRERFYYRIADIASWTINSKLSVDQKLEWFPQVEDQAAYQLRLEANLRYKLAENLALVMTVIDRYETDPASRVDNNDLQLRSSIGLSF